MFEQCNIDHCSIYKTQNIIKHKWIPIIVYVIDNDDVTFSYIQQRILHISEKRLSTSLRLLLDHDLLQKDEKDYSLTNKGKELLNIIHLMEQFSS